MADIDSAGGIDASEHDEHGGFDRRAALKKAAVAGGIMWATPTLLATSASATDIACTPKCGPTIGGTWTGNISKLACEKQGPLNELHPYKFQVGNVTAAGSACGCGASPVLTLSGGTTFTMRNDDWQHGYCNLGSGNHIGWIGRHPNRPGNIAAGIPIYATISCTDRRGRKLCRTCEIAGRFEYCHQFRWPWEDELTCADIPSTFSVTWTTVPNSCTAQVCC